MIAIAAALVATLAAVPAAGAPTGRAAPPSFLYILADDLGVGEMEWMGGEGRTPTPFLNEFAAGGVVLEGHVSHSICVPSRAALLTGRKPHTMGMDGRAKMLPLGIPLLSDRLKALGYATSMVGKWHLGGLQDKQHLPTRRGFDQFLGIAQGAADPYTYTQPIPDLNDQIFYTLMRDEEIAYADDERSDLVQNKFSTELYVNETLRMLSEVPAGTPFFHYFSMQMVHAPLRYAPDFPDPSKPMMDSMVRQVDAAMQRLMAGIADLGLDGNLVTVFVSDNGGQITQSGQGSNLPLNGGKFMVHEGGIRTPAIVNSPLLGASRGQRSSEFVAIEDWMPTILSLAGGQVGNDIDGFDIWPVIAELEPSPRKTWISIVSLYGNGNPTRTVRSERYKYIRDVSVLEGGTCSEPFPPDNQLPDDTVYETIYECVFDLQENPAEQAPLTPDHPLYAQIVEEASAIMATQEALIPATQTRNLHPDLVNFRLAIDPPLKPGYSPVFPLSPLTSRMPASTDPILAEVATGKQFNRTWVPPCYNGLDPRNDAPCNVTQLSTDEVPGGPRELAIEVTVYNWLVDDTALTNAYVRVRVELGDGTVSGGSIRTNEDGVATFSFETSAVGRGIRFCRERIFGGGEVWDPCELVSCFEFW